MEMFYLYLWMSGNAAIIPEKYNSKEECDKAGMVSAVVAYRCIPAPKHDDFNCSMMVADPMNRGQGMVAKVRCSDTGKQK